jgi:hypothetical protein
MSIPIENAIIYVEPIYIQASGGDNNLPELKKVVVCYQNEIVMADSLELALAQVFDIQEILDDNAVPQSTGGSTSTNAELVVKANSLFKEAQEAQKAGNWAGYGQKINELEQVLAQLTQLSGVTQ